MTWQNGRELATFSQTNGASVSYTYDASGMRAGKTVTKDGTTTQFKYVYEGGLLRQMTRGARIYDFSYDANGTPVSMSYRINATTTPTYYYYGTNWRGDVVALYNSSGSITALYEYDAYGNVTVKSTNGQVNTSESHIANINPIHYRGYVYDTETGFYYLQSRYYDPTTCRFVNADSIVSGIEEEICGNNMFAYCFNNPINRTDSSGQWPVWAIICVVVVAVVAISTAVNHIVNACNDKKINTEINDSYTKQQAKAEIDDILDNYNPDCSITFDLPTSNGYATEISESHHVKSRYDRQKICKIIERTNVTTREYDNMSSEWVLHNVGKPISFLEEKSRSVGLDYTKDSRWFVVFPTKMLEILGWE